MVDVTGRQFGKKLAELKKTRKAQHKGWTEEELAALFFVTAKTTRGWKKLPKFTQKLAFFVEKVFAKHGVES
jgi:hypothetical protein